MITGKKEAPFKYRGYAGKGAFFVELNRLDNDYLQMLPMSVTMGTQKGGRPDAAVPKTKRALS